MAEIKENEYFSQEILTRRRPEGCKGMAEIKENEYFSQKRPTGGGRRGVRK